MPFANDAVAEVTAVAVPSTLNVIGLDGAGVAGAGVVGTVGDGAGVVAVGVGDTGVDTELPPPPHAIAIAAMDQTTSPLRQLLNLRPNLGSTGVFIGHHRVAFRATALQDCGPY
jgi:hypothetical protein